MAKRLYAGHLKRPPERGVGSNPSTGTKMKTYRTDPSLIKEFQEVLAKLPYDPVYEAVRARAEATVRGVQKLQQLSRRTSR